MCVRRVAQANCSSQERTSSLAIAFSHRDFPIFLQAFAVLAFNSVEQVVHVAA